MLKNPMNKIIQIIINHLFWPKQHPKISDNHQETECGMHTHLARLSAQKANDANVNSLGVGDFGIFSQNQLEIGHLWRI